MIAPGLVVHADWGTKPRKRQMASARLEADADPHGPSYRVTSLEPAPAYELLGSLSRVARPGQALVGFDYPIGLPRAYAAAGHLSTFPAFLADDLQSPPWKDFSLPARTPDEISLQRPFYPQTPGGAKRQHLYEKLALTSKQLRRRCERDDAETMFWTLGGKQVGKGALAGWGLLAKAQRSDHSAMKIWPFDGPLETLLDGRRGIVVTETYPREYYRHIQPAESSTTAWSKRRQEDRLKWIPAMLEWASSLRVHWQESVLHRVEGGFAGDASGEDEFDAVVGLLGMIAVIGGAIPSGEPEDDAVATIEGWILGRPCYRDVPMPDWFALGFQLPTGDWIDQAFCTPEQFSRERDGSYLRSDGGSGLWIRASHIDKRGVIDHVDGAGERHRYRLLPLPSKHYEGLPDPREQPNVPTRRSHE